MNYSSYDKIHKLLIDENELQKFWNFLPELKPNEFYRIDLCTKHKYCIDKIIYKFKNSFVDKKNILNYKKLIKAIKKWELLQSIFTYTNKNEDIEEEIIFPAECYSVYFSINPSNGIKVFNSMKKHYDGLMNKMIETYQNNNFNDELLREFSRLEHKLYSESHKPTNRTKYFLDIDIDIDKNDIDLMNIFENLVNKFKNNNLRFMVVETIGGFHILIDRKTIKYNYTKDLLWAKDKLYNYELEHFKETGKNGFEIIQNDAAFIPLPGTTRGGFVVKVREIYSK